METAYFITAIVSLATAVVTLWYHNNRREKKFNEQQSENLLRYHEASITMTNELAKNSKVIENNTKAHEKVFEYLINGKKK